MANREYIREMQFIICLIRILISQTEQCSKSVQVYLFVRPPKMPIFKSIHIQNEPKNSFPLFYVYQKVGQRMRHVILSPPLLFLHSPNQQKEHVKYLQFRANKKTRIASNIRRLLRLL